MPPRREKTNIVILGATGRIGRLVSAAFKRCCPGDFCIWRQRRNAVPSPDPYDFYWDFTQEGDALGRLADREGGIHALINLAGVTPASGDRAYGENKRLAIASLTHAASCNVPCVFLASSAAVYGVPQAGQRLGENDQPRPASAYGGAKLEMEQAGAEFSMAHGASAPRVTALRIANVAGADQLLSNALGATTHKPLMLDRFADGSGPVRSYIGPETLARVFVSLIRASLGEIPLPTILNVASPEPVSMASLLKALAAQAQSVPVKFVPAPQGAIRQVVLATKALEPFHDFTPKDSQPQEMIRQWLALRGRI